MPEDQAYDLLDDIDFYYNKVKCRKIEKLLPVLNNTGDTRAKVSLACIEGAFNIYIFLKNEVCLQC